MCFRRDYVVFIGYGDILRMNQIDEEFNHKYIFFISGPTRVLLV